MSASDGVMGGRPRRPGSEEQPVSGGTAVYKPTAAPPASGTQVYVPARDRAAAPPPLPPSGTAVYREGTAVYRPEPAPGAPQPFEMAPPTGDEPGPGDRVRHYELIRRLGKGGMGEVFLARDTKLGRRVAIKFLHTQDPALVDRFVLEARATARCSHENIVTLYEADTFNGRPYMALEYLEGDTLAALIRDAGPMPPSRAVELVVPVLRALTVAHAEGIVHRDLKPENVLLTDAGVIKVLDFGIAKVLGGEQRAIENAQAPAPSMARRTAHQLAASDSSLTEHGMTIGTVQYMSPEQWTGEQIDHRSDLWSLGVMLFRMLAGKHPLDGLEGMQLSCVADLSVPMPSLRGAAPEVPAGLADAVDACLLKDREQRPADALTLLRALEPFTPGRIERGSLQLDESPFAGLSSFQEEDADRFFGRTHEIAALVKRLRERPTVAVVGPSGVGKSSFVRAGVVPALKRLGEGWETLVVRPGRDPLAALASAVAALGSITSPGTVSDELREEKDLLGRLRAEPGHAGALLRAHARRQDRKVLLFVDQLEEIYTLVPDVQERLAFTACLGGVADDATSPVRLVLSVRSDFLERISEDPRFMAELSHGLFFLTTPADQGLREALTVPAEMAGYRFETPAMVDELLRDLRSTHGALSLLQFAASQLWEARDPARRVLTRASYEAIGGISGALARYADRVLEELSQEARTTARDLFLRLVTPERTRAIVSTDELHELAQGGRDVEQLLEHLVQARLVVIQKSDQGSTAEIVHESLIHGWPTLARWLDETGEDAHFLEQLRAAAKQWGSHGQTRDLLWRGELADEARRFQRRLRRELPEVQREFLEAVLAERTARARRRRALAVGGVTALLVIVVASLVAVFVIRRAQQEAIRQEGIARTAEAASRQRAEELTVKERERAEAARRAEAASAELQVKNTELQGALGAATEAQQRAQEAQQHAQDARQRAERNADAARRAQEAANRSAKELAVRLTAEKERVKRLEQQFGSPMAETLPR
jgi:serine/threonine protein kinase